MCIAMSCVKKFWQKNIFETLVSFCETLHRRESLQEAIGCRSNNRFGRPLTETLNFKNWVKPFELNHLGKKSQAQSGSRLRSKSLGLCGICRNSAVKSLSWVHFLVAKLLLPRCRFVEELTLRTSESAGVSPQEFSRLPRAVLQLWRLLRLARKW